MLCTLSFREAFAQNTDYYWAAFKHLEQQLPEGAVLEEAPLPPYAFQIQQGFMPFELALFEASLAEKLRPSQLKRLSAPPKKPAIFPVDLLSVQQPRSLLRLSFAEARPPLLLLKLEKLRPFASNPKIALDNQVLNTYQLLFYFDAQGNIEAVFTKKLF